MSKNLLQEGFMDHPQYTNVRVTKLMTLSDYLELATISWAVRWGHKLPILDTEGQADIQVDIDGYIEWLFGDVNPLKVIDGGRKDKSDEL